MNERNKKNEWKFKTIKRKWKKKNEVRRRRKKERNIRQGKGKERQNKFQKKACQKEGSKKKLKSSLYKH